MGKFPLGKIIEYEEGQLDYEGVCSLFQELVDTGAAWELQGHYGRVAQDLIDDGAIIDRGVIDHD